MEELKLSNFKISDQFFKMIKIWDQNGIKSVQFNKLNIYFDNFYKFMSIYMYDISWGIHNYKWVRANPTKKSMGFEFSLCNEIWKVLLMLIQLKIAL
jgi:hypothetical protein